jgi:hypothetical protein
MPNTKARVIGSGFTTFNYRGKPIAFLDSFTDSGQAPIAQPEQIMQLDSKHPIEIATPRALSAGRLAVSIRELWAAPVWHGLAGLEGTNDIVDVYQALAADPTEVTCQILIKPPGATIWRGKTYHGCVVTSIDDSEQVTIGALSVARLIDITYTHTKPFTINAS